MHNNDHMHPDNLERYAFVWSEVRLVLAAGALFLGGVPVIYYLLDMLSLLGLSRLVSAPLQIAQLISGIAAGYLLYRWHTGGQTLFGAADQKDKIAFLVLVVSGLNLGWYAISDANIGMDIANGNRLVFLVAGAAYLWAGWHLRERWLANGERLFAGAGTPTVTPADTTEPEEQSGAREAEVVEESGAEGGSQD